LFLLLLLWFSLSMGNAEECRRVVRKGWTTSTRGAEPSKQKTTEGGYKKRVRGRVVQRCYESMLKSKEGQK
jgi:hypothetical protein